MPGARWETKRWPPEKWAKLIEQMLQDGLPPAVMLGAPDDREFTDKIISACDARIVNLVGKTSLRELAAILALAGLVVCHDSGPMHIAAALGRPLVAVFGPTNPTRTGPYSPLAQVVQLSLECVPCYSRQCPLGHHNCMRQIDMERVAHDVREKWAVASKSAGCPASPVA